MAIKSKRKAKKRRQTIQGIAIGGSAFVIIVFVVAATFSLRGSQVERAPETQCRIDGANAAETALIVDTTDSMTKNQQLVANKLADKLIKEAIIDERISLFLVEQEQPAENIKIAVQACNPGDGKEKSELTHNRRRLFDAWNNGFNIRVKEYLAELIGKEPGKNSPIIETIQSSAYEVFYGSTADKKTLFIISDMVQNSTALSHYENIPDLADPDLERGSQSFQLPLSGVKVYILYLGRSHLTHIQKRKHITFWERIISRSGGTLVKVERVD